MSCRPAGINGLETLLLHGGLSPGAPRGRRNGYNTYPIGRDQSARPRRRGHRMKRREFITLLGGAVTVWPLTARGQQQERMLRIGVLMNMAADDPEGQARIVAFVRGLQESGWTDGHNV